MVRAQAFACAHVQRAVLYDEHQGEYSHAPPVSEVERDRLGDRLRKEVTVLRAAS
jgi:hypothetical protein